MWGMLLIFSPNSANLLLEFFHSPISCVSEYSRNRLLPPFGLSLLCRIPVCIWPILSLEPASTILPKRCGHLTSKAPEVHSRNYIIAAACASLIDAPQPFTSSIRPTMSRASNPGGDSPAVTESTTTRSPLV